jgi:peptide/nickel transport system permease protein
MNKISESPDSSPARLADSVAGFGSPPHIVVVENLKVFIGNRMAFFGLLLLSVLAALALVAPWVSPYDPTLADLRSSLQPPSRHHLLGTDSLGHDVLSRVIFGGRVSLGVGITAVTLAAVIGGPLGLASGYYGRTLDNLLMRIMDAVISFPSFVLAIAVVGSLGPSIFNLIAVLSVVYSPVIARVVRAATLAAREAEYVAAARAIGARDPGIIFRHILPNLTSVLVVQGTVIFSWAIITEASLSFLGLGIQPPTPSWGLDLSEARRFLGEANWTVLGPAVAVVVTVLASNFLGDGLRDAFDPRHK